MDCVVVCVICTAVNVGCIVGGGHVFDVVFVVGIIFGSADVVDDADIYVVSADVGDCGVCGGVC